MNNNFKAFYELHKKRFKDYLHMRDSYFYFHPIKILVAALSSTQHFSSTEQSIFALIRALFNGGASDYSVQFDALFSLFPHSKHSSIEWQKFLFSPKKAAFDDTKTNRADYVANDSIDLRTNYLPNLAKNHFMTNLKFL